MKKYLVILSGWAAEPFVWDPILNLLEDEYEIILVGWNDVCSLGDFKQKAIDAIRKKGIERFSLIGWSLGSLVAIDIAADNIFEIEKIVLIGGTSRFTQSSSENYNCGWDEKIVCKMMRSLEKNTRHTLNSFYKKMFSHAEIKRGCYDRFINGSIPFSGPDSADSLLLGLEYLVKSDFRKEISKMDIPALLIHGCNDLICSADASKYIKSHLKTCKLIVFEETGHMPFYTDTKICREAIDVFLEDDGGDDYYRQRETKEKVQQKRQEL